MRDSNRAAVAPRRLPAGDLWFFDEIHKFREWRNFLKGLFGEFEHGPFQIPAVERRAPATAKSSPAGYRLVLACVSLCKEVHNMRTNIEIDEKLMKDALKATGAKTKRAAVELGLKTLVMLRAQEKARELKGKITWEGNLNAMRTDC